MERIQYFKNVAKAFEFFQKANPNNVSEVLLEANNLKNKYKENVKLTNITFENVYQAVAYIYWVEENVMDSDEIYYNNYPLNYNIDKNTIEEEYAVYATYKRDYIKQSTDLPLSQYFTRLVFVKKDQIDLVEHVYISDTKKYLNDSQEFNIAFIPIGLDFKLNNLEKSNDTFRQGENEIDNKFIQSFDEALLKNNSIIFSCEICGCEGIDDYIFEKYKSKYALCVASPSYHRTIENKNYNKSKIFYYDKLNIETKEVEKCEKFFLFDKEKNKNIYLEILDSVKPKFILVHLKDIGVVLFAICKDVLTNKFKELVETLNPNITIVIAYTKHYEEFNARTSQLTSTGNVVIVGNSCYAYDGEEHCPIVAFHKEKNKNNKIKDITYTCKYKNDCRNLECCYFTITIQKNSNQGYKVIKMEQVVRK